MGAQLRGAESLAFDGPGNLYIADGGNNCIRKVTAKVVAGAAQSFDGSEVISTVAGISRQPGNSGEMVPATTATMNSPRGIAIDPASGTLYITDQNNKNIRKEDAAGMITTVGASETYSLPTGVAVDPVTADVYVADVLNSKVLRIVAATGVVTTFAGTGTSSAVGSDLGEGGPATGSEICGR